MLKLLAEIGRLASAITKLLVGSKREYDYVVAMVFAAVPVGTAALAGILHDSGDFIGYLSARNWVSLILTLPVVLWVLRWVVSTLDPGNEKVPPVVNLFPAAQEDLARKDLNGVFFSPVNLCAAIGVMLIVQASDFAEVGGLYLRRFLDASQLKVEDIRERDWSVMKILDPHVGPVLGNLAATITAYSVQFTVGVLAFLILILLLRHNLYFISRIYQRRRARRNSTRPYIVVNWDHGDGRFGFGCANHAFNCEVRILALAGVLLLASRFHNVGAQQSRLFYEALPVLLKLLKLEVTDLAKLDAVSGTLPDIGQRILVLSWLLLLVVISIPTLVKFLPFGAKEGLDMDRTGYLKEFVPEELWPGDAKIDETAKKFAKNSFWPTGDNRALWLFGIAMMVFFVMAFPLRPIAGRIPEFLACYAVFLAIGFGSAAAAFRLLRASLSYIDKSLVEGSEK
jgi:hypothetical protein